MRNLEQVITEVSNEKYEPKWQKFKLLLPFFGMSNKK